MAEVALVLGVPHTPLLWRLLQPPIPDDLRGVADTFARFRSLLAAADVDAIVLVASDHFRQLFHHNMPAFLVGNAEQARGTHPNEVRAFGLPRVEVGLHPGLATAVLGRHQLTPEFDFAYSNQPWLDHGFVLPLLYVDPDLTTPVVPIHTNTNAPPIPAAERFLQLGGYLRRAIAAWEGGDRVAVVGSGHLAYELGGPRQFTGASPSPDFDRKVCELLEKGDGEGLVELCSYQRMLAAGNLTFQVLNFLVCLGAAGEPAHVIDPVACRFGNEPFFAWVLP